MNQQPLFDGKHHGLDVTVYDTHTTVYDTHKEQAHIVFKLLYDNREFRDKLYKMSVSNYLYTGTYEMLQIAVDTDVTPEGLVVLERYEDLSFDTIMNRIEEDFNASCSDLQELLPHILKAVELTKPVPVPFRNMEDYMEHHITNSKDQFRFEQFKLLQMIYDAKITGLGDDWNKVLEDTQAKEIFASVYKGDRDSFQIEIDYLEELHYFTTQPLYQSKQIVTPVQREAEIKERKRLEGIELQLKLRDEISEKTLIGMVTCGQCADVLLYYYEYEHYPLNCPNCQSEQIPSECPDWMANLQDRSGTPIIPTKPTNNPNTQSAL